MEENKLSEEVSVTPLIRDIERLIGKSFRAIKRLFVFMLEGVVEFFLLAFKFKWVLLLTIIIGGVAGFYSTRVFPRQYSSSMLLRINVDAKDQLLNDISFFNSLVGRSDTKELQEILQLTAEEAQSIQGFEVFPQSDFIEKTQAMQDLYASIDTSIFNALEVEQMMSADQMAYSSRFRIVIFSSKQDVFKNMETSLLAYLERVPELNNMLKTDLKSLHFQREIYVSEMATLDTLTKVMNEVMLLKANQPQGTGSSEMNVIMGTDPLKANDVSPLDLQDRYMFYAQRIAKIDSEIERHKSCYFVRSHLNPYGEKIGYGPLGRAIISAFVLFVFVYLMVGFRFWGAKSA